MICTSLKQLSVGVPSLSASGPDSGQFSGRIISNIRHFHSMQQFHSYRVAAYQSCSLAPQESAGFLKPPFPSTGPAQ